MKHSLWLTILYLSFGFANAQTPTLKGFIPIPDAAYELYYLKYGEGTPDLVVIESMFIEGEIMPLTDQYTVVFVHSRSGKLAVYW